MTRQTPALSTSPAGYDSVCSGIVEAEQKGKRRAGYGEQLIERLSQDLTLRFGRGFSPDNLENMRRFFLAYPAIVIFETVCGKFTLTQLTHLSGSTPIHAQEIAT